MIQVHLGNIVNAGVYYNEQIPTYESGECMAERDGGGGGAVGGSVGGVIATLFYCCLIYMAFQKKKQPEQTAVEKYDHDHSGQA